MRGNEDFQRQGGDGETCFTKECIAASHRYVIFLKYPVWWTGFFPSLNWIFLPDVACKIQVWKTKNPVHQTWYFKLENCENQVQINSGKIFKRILLLILDYN